MFDWESQAKQYARQGEPGIHLEKHNVRTANTLSVVDCLLSRDKQGHLVGILNHYNEDNPWERPGAMNVWVEPSHRRQGIATDLLRQANELWHLTNEHLSYTPDGDAWIQGLVDKGKIDPERTRSLE